MIDLEFLHHFGETEDGVDRLAVDSAQGTDREKRPVNRRVSVDE